LYKLSPNGFYEDDIWPFLKKSPNILCLHWNLKYDILIFALHTLAYFEPTPLPRTTAKIITKNTVSCLWEASEQRIWRIIELQGKRRYVWINDFKEHHNFHFWQDLTIVRDKRWTLPSLPIFVVFLWRRHVSFPLRCLGIFA
jgi:hypothetical protein